MKSLIQKTKSLLGAVGISLIILTSIAPLPAFAALTCTTGGGATANSLKDIVCIGIDYINLALYFIMGLATLMFVWNVYRYYFRPEQDRTEAGLYVLYAVIGFFVILSMWGLVNVVAGTFKLSTNNLPNTFPGVGAPNSNAGGTGNFPISAPTIH